MSAASSASSRVGPWYQGVFGEWASTLSPTSAETGTGITDLISMRRAVSETSATSSL